MSATDYRILDTSTYALVSDPRPTIMATIGERCYAKDEDDPTYRLKLEGGLMVGATLLVIEPSFMIIHGSLECTSEERRDGVYKYFRLVRQSGGRWKMEIITVKYPDDIREPIDDLRVLPWTLDLNT